MTAITAELAPVDTCPACPGDNPPCLSLSSRPDGDGTIASYRCPCGTAWAARFDRWGWPVNRSVAPARSTA